MQILLAKTDEIVEKIFGTRNELAKNINFEGCKEAIVGDISITNVTVNETERKLSDTVELQHESSIVINS